jgi:prepilin-type processing-associated H-X9-DG protein
MEALTSLGEELVHIADEPAPRPRAQSSRRIVPWVILAAPAGLVVLFLTFVDGNAVRESRRAQCQDKLTRIGLALYEYCEAQGHFPAPAVAARDGTPLLSWRVALLPYLGYRALYEQFRLDEAWDSPHNRRLLSKMPAEFACPAAARRSAGRTGYVVIVGPKFELGSVNTPFEPGRGADLREFDDGTSNTVLVLETDVSIPWTKPDDAHWSPGGEVPHLKSPHRGGAHMLFADCHAQFVKAGIRPEIMLALFTINGHEVLSAG